MTDPAVEAAQRAWVARRGAQVRRHFDPDNYLEQAHIATAREALKPLRALHKPGPISRLGTAWMVGGTAECTTCRRDWPCETAKKIYPTEELEEENGR